MVSTFNLRVATSISEQSALAGEADVDVSFQDVVKKLDMAFMGTAELRYKRWGFMGDIIYARLHDDIAPPAGILFSSTHEVVKETIGTFLLSYRAVDHDRTYLDLFAGARVYSFYSEIVLRPNLAPVGFSADGTSTWVDPIIGLRGRCYLSNLFFVNGYGDVGGFGPVQLSGRSLAPSASGASLVRRAGGYAPWALSTRASEQEITRTAPSSEPPSF